ncbi:MAG: hypothetical protein ABL958_08870 [Bdellovibrionia bacterium]
MRFSVFILLALSLSGCGFIVESFTDLSNKGPTAPGLLDIPVQPVYLRSNDSYMQADGSCQGYAVIEFTYSSPLTPLNTVYGKCTDDKVSAQLPVQQGEQKQVFTVKIVGYLQAPTTTENLPPSLTVNYNPPVRMIAGFAITSGGSGHAGTSSAGAKILNQSVGEAYSVPKLPGNEAGSQSSAQAKSRNGLQGSLDP